MKFTQKIAQYIVENQIDYADLTIVLPSERAKKYLAASIFEVHKKPVLAPKMITMDAWIRQNSSKTIIDKTRALVKLFEIQLKHAKTEEQRSFDDFLEWGPLLLSDFDELDRYLVDVQTVFKDLHNIKELEYWKIEAEDEFQLSQARKRFLEFWDLLPTYYTELQKSLLQMDAAYMGAAYKEIATNINLLFTENKKSTYLFAGFNALSKAETSIMRQLKEMGRGHIIVDADEFYVNDSNHEAGAFIRKQKMDLDIKKLYSIDNKIATKPLEIEVVECAQVTGQVKVASSVLMELSPAELQDTVVLLADESLIGPLLKNIPRNVGKANITLGMPMKGTSVKNWVDILFSMQESKARFKTNAIYHNDLIRLINHPFFIACLTDADKSRLQELEATIIKKNWIFIVPNAIRFNEELMQIIDLANLDWKKDWTVAMGAIRRLNSILFGFFNPDDQFEKALIHSFDSALIEFQNIVAEELPEMSLRSFKGLFTQHWSNKGIAYHGNPIDGLQIMGLLETRMLDFKRIICIGLNEGVMPPTNPIQSMFPMDLRRYSGLPVPRDKQGLFAHHFYRLLHHCETMIVTYAGTKESIGSSEKSRYLLQIEKELVRASEGNVVLKPKFYNIPMEEQKQVGLVSIQKNEAIFKRMDELFARSTSISTLKKYHDCNLDFYYKYILEFGEEDEVEEELESNTLGTIIHASFEDLYEKHAKYDKDGNLNQGGGLPLRVSDVDEMIVRAPERVRHHFMIHFNNDEKAFLNGKNYLSFQMALTMVNAFLKEERKFIDAPNTVIIHSLEKIVQLPMDLEVNGIQKTILLNGTIDRVDEVNGQIRLVDYKSGAVKSEDLEIKTVAGKSGSTRLDNFKKKHAMQMAMYIYLYFKSTNRIPDQSGLISMIQAKTGFIPIKSTASMLEIIEAFPEWIQEIFDELYDDEIPFEHNSKVQKEFSYCAYCH